MKPTRLTPGKTYILKTYLREIEASFVIRIPREGRRKSENIFTVPEFETPEDPKGIVILSDWEVTHKCTMYKGD